MVNLKKVIPSFFAKEYLFRISSSSQDMILKVQDGRTWSVKYYVRPDRVTSKTRIERGWKAFVEDNYLKVGDVCAFVLRKSIGIVLFEVVIFHENGVANSPMLPIPAAYMRSSTTPSKPKITPCVKIEPSFTNNSNDKESMVSQDLIAKKEIVEPSDKFMKVKSEANTDDNQGSNNKRLSSSEAASKFISNNPYLQVNLRSSQVYGGRPYIPMAFGNLYFEKKAQTVTFWVGEKNWLVNLTVNKRSVGLEYRFSSGWAAFARGNCLQPSDVCIFELIQRNQLQMKVTIFRQNGLPL
ncbi:B3 domain-containing transcription factor VRN1-like [Cannabis sativa]|uniref:B3 domain-containing transcription factor VRN1-like n=1 Tax=Cannabis sativa TaxID=3483 RepID=UPI0029CA8248|nr:B3 domain-containing transcription factor VRN1-like [Cannabis sativa]